LHIGDGAVGKPNEGLHMVFVGDFVPLEFVERPDDALDFVGEKLQQPPKVMSAPVVKQPAEIALSERHQLPGL